MKYQQGDVLFIKTNEEVKYSNNEDNSYISLGQYSKANKNDSDGIDGKTIVALGEGTGHSHTFYKNDNPDTVVNTYGIIPNIKGLGDVPMYVEVKAKPEKFAIIKHEEHKPLSLPPGVYKTRIVKEFNHISQRTENVVD